VERGRYTYLDQATQQVNKAAMGQIGALRRAGIQIDKNATATQALTALQKAYGGAAVKYSNSAAGAADNLAVAWENLAEVAGGPLSNGLASVANGLTFVIKQMTGVQNTAELTAATLKDPDFIKAMMAFNGAVKGASVLNQLFANQIVAPGEGHLGGSGLTGKGKGGKAGATPPSLVTAIPAKLEDDLLNARISGSSARIKAALQAQAAFIQRALGQAKLSRSQRVGLKEALIAVNAEIDGINQDAASAAKQAADDAKNARDAAKAKQKEAAEKAKAAARKAAEAAKRAAEALKDYGENMKDAALAQLDAVQDKRNVNRDLADAKDALVQARQIGGKRGILEAKRGLEDAQFARRRLLLENATVTPEGKKRSQGFSVQIGTAHFHGVQDVKGLQAALSKVSNRSTSQSRGHSPGIPHGL
jgi:hypothetical protein